MVSASRSGFSLVEATAALVILAIGVLSAAGVASAAAALLRAAELEERALTGAATLIDSLLHSGGDGAGEHRDGPLHFSWQVRTGHATEAVVLVRFPAGSSYRQVLLGGLGTPP
jgi:type II secretory pathway pseudopilin PulG